MNRTRREFLSSLLAVGAGVGLVTVIGCGDDDAPADTGTDGGGTDGGGTDGGGTDGGGTDGGGTDGGGTDGGGTDGGATDGGGADASDGAMAASCAVVTVNIGTNHSHAMTVSEADVTAGVAKSYDLMGTATHNHTVSLNAGDFTTLAGGGTVTKDSSQTGTSGGGHRHEIMVTCGA